ncbi:sensor histidine kinase [Priestia filamentosa]|uniref:sensor histidine kinase n=1 Tax=Priestia filamentosa TaxID=1402861 RepID=UPI0013147926|nr:GHKL domain-containing protein [Priestia filamentosa]MDT3765708.1 GHKL domain-containing protein [Priestia filamentosa]WCM16176.1 GHKL domain-containing protein [Priestia filamentosa]WRU95615.1 GHKL domain-containing protein [Priestia filamentosa]
MYLILITVLFALMLRLSIKQYKIKQKEKENENFELYVKSLEQANNDMRKFRHDYVNILSTLRAYIDEGDNAGLKEYFNNHILATQQKVVDHNLTLGRLNNLGIKGIKGLLTTKIIQAQEKQVEIDLEITEQVKFINMDTIELNRVLGILLDNAIEASINQSGPMIRVAFINLEASILIVVLNKITNPAIKVHEIYREGYSTKGPNRGVGLSILKEIVSRSEHITLNTRIDDHYFIQELEIKERNIKNGSYHM